MALAIPNGTCELLIPKDRYDPFAIAAVTGSGMLVIDPPLGSTLPPSAEIEDLREFVRECTLGILDSVPDLPKREAEMEAAVLCGAYARRCGHQWASLRKVLADYPELLAQVPDKPGPVDALPLLPRRGHGRRAQGQARAAAGDVRRGAGGEGRTAYQAHREGIRKLREWEDNDFDRARYESRMRLFDDEMEDTDDGAPEEGLCRGPAQGPITR
jgi:hypothetical protein